MEQKDLLIESLITLCKREGGHQFVADKTRVSAHGLWQIIHRVKLPSGNPRGVGPKLRKKLNEAYPHWLEQGDKPAIEDADAFSPEAVMVARLLDRFFDADVRLSVMTACVNAMQQFELRTPSKPEPAPAGAAETSGAKYPA